MFAQMRCIKLFLMKKLRINDFPKASDFLKKKEEKEGRSHRPGFLTRFLQR